MSVFRCKIIFLFLIAFAACNTQSGKNQAAGQKAFSSFDDSVRMSTQFNDKQDTLPEVWIQYSDKSKIPKALLKQLDVAGGEPFEIANLKDPFQSTDVIANEKLPGRQLRFLGKSDSLWLMTYKHGGIGAHYHLVLCEVFDNNVRMFRTGISLSELENLSQIRKALLNQKIIFKNISEEKELDKI